MLISKNAVAIILLFFSVLGLEVSEEGLMELVSAIGTIMSFTAMLLNQISRTDTYAFLFKKKK